VTAAENSSLFFGPRMQLEKATRSSQYTPSNSAFSTTPKNIIVQANDFTFTNAAEEIGSLFDYSGKEAKNSAKNKSLETLSRKMVEALQIGISIPTENDAAKSTKNASKRQFVEVVDDRATKSAHQSSPIEIAPSHKKLKKQEEEKNVKKSDGGKEKSRHVHQIFEEEEEEENEEMQNDQPQPQAVQISQSSIIPLPGILYISIVKIKKYKQFNISRK
jgi:hypothetical protein